MGARAGRPRTSYQAPSLPRLVRALAADFQAAHQDSADKLDPFPRLSVLRGSQQEVRRCAPRVIQFLLQNAGVETLPGTGQQTYDLLNPFRDPDDPEHPISRAGWAAIAELPEAPHDAITIGETMLIDLAETYPHAVPMAQEAIAALRIGYALAGRAIVAPTGQQAA